MPNAVEEMSPKQKFYDISGALEVFLTTLILHLTEDEPLLNQPIYPPLNDFVREALRVELKGNQRCRNGFDSMAKDDGDVKL